MRALQTLKYQVARGMQEEFMGKKKKIRMIRRFLTAFAITLLVGILGMLAWQILQEKNRTQEVSVQEPEQKQLTKQPEQEPDMQEPDMQEKNSEDTVQQETQSSTDAQQQEAQDEEDTDPPPDGAEDTAQQQDNTDAPQKAVLVFGGDICFYDAYANMCSYVQRGSDIEKCISSYLLEEMRSADVCMVNNEFSYSDRGAPLADKTYTFRSKPENVNILHDMGVDVVSIANNHAYDYGPDAFLDTLQILDDAGVKRVGGGRDLADASRPVFFSMQGFTVGIVSATQIERNDTPDTRGAAQDAPGVLRCFNERELEHFLGVVEDAKAQCDFLVAYVHWGTENTDEIDWAQPYQADLISKAGADLIVGCHPHCLQGLDIFNGVPVVYSMGNYWFNSKTLDTALLKIVVGKDGLESMQMIAARQADCSTAELTGSEKARVLDYLQSLSPNVQIDGDGIVTW